MRGVFSPDQLAHAPQLELNNGEWISHSETPDRAIAIRDVLSELEPATEFGEGPIAAVHDPEYLLFLKTAHQKWHDTGRVGDAIAYTFPTVRRRKLSLSRIDALVGQYSFDAATPIAAGTWHSAYASAQSALTAAAMVKGGERHAFALCRPPGHHAGRDYCGGYCYLNTAAIAAQAARDSWARRVAIIDIDYHHGNGTQDIFWQRPDVFYASVHADPATDYPFYWGHADEIGAEAGRDATLNLPLPRGSGIVAFRRAQSKALEAIGRFSPDLLIVSYGADTWEGDPISHFSLTTQDHALLARDISQCGWPTLIVMEGGYATGAIGANVASFLSGF